MKEHPIVFSGPMIRAIMSGTKTQTRRVIKGAWSATFPAISGGIAGEYHTSDRSFTGRYLTCPTPDDLLWVRETWAVRALPVGYWAEYKADARNRRIPEQYNGLVAPKATGVTWQPSISMPRFLSRITLRITTLRVERVQDISEVDARAEGIRSRGAFATLWDNINAKRGHGWSSNPWVWVIGFEVAR